MRKTWLTSKSLLPSSLLLDEIDNVGSKLAKGDAGILENEKRDRLAIAAVHQRKMNDF